MFLIAVLLIIGSYTTEIKVCKNRRSLCIDAIRRRNQPDLGSSRLNSVAVLRGPSPRRRRPIHEIVVGDVFALRLVALKAGARRTKRFRKKSLAAADAGRYPTAEKIITRRARRESMLITSGLGGIRSVAQQIKRVDE